jgi:hypothetical protein
MSTAIKGGTIVAADRKYEGQPRPGRRRLHRLERKGV